MFSPAYDHKYYTLFVSADILVGLERASARSITMAAQNQIAKVGKIFKVFQCIRAESLGIFLSMVCTLDLSPAGTLLV